FSLPTPSRETSTSCFSNCHDPRCVVRTCVYLDLCVCVCVCVYVCVADMDKRLSELSIWQAESWAAARRQMLSWLPRSLSNGQTTSSSHGAVGAEKVKRCRVHLSLGSSRTRRQDLL